VQDRTATTGGAGHRCLIPKVRFDDANLRQVAQVVEGAFGQVVEADDLAPLGNEPAT
jgi:hypothetical protein